jgi:iron complex outermembrane receptor protein
MSLKDLLNVMTLESDMQVSAATKANVQSAEAPSIITVIPRSTIRARGFRTIGEALATVPGLYVVDDHLTSNVAIRGIHGGSDSWSRLIKVMVDGQAVTDYGTGGSLLGPEFIPMDAVEAIEVIRGPASALYGANAFLGVVNVVTRRPDPDGHLYASGEAGFIGDRFSTAGELFASAHFGGAREGEMIVAASGAKLDRSGLSVPEVSPAHDRYLDENGEAGRSEGDLSKPYSLLGRASWRTADLGNFTLMALTQRLDARANFSVQSVLERANRRALQNTVARVTYELPFRDDRALLRAFAAYSTSKSLPQELLEVGESTFTLRRIRENQARQGGLELDLKLGAPASLLVGIDYLHDRDAGDTIYVVVRDSGNQIPRSTGAPRSYGNLGIYAQGIVRPLPRLGVTAGLRYDLNEVWDSVPNGRLAAVYEIVPRLHVKLLWGTSFVPPSPSQLDGAPLRIDGERGNANLRSQTAQTIETAVSYHLGQASVQLNAFWTRVNDRIELVAAGSNLTAENLTDSNTIGVEAAGELNWSPWYVRGNASWQATALDRPADAPSWWSLVYDPDGPGGARPPGVPAWNAHLTLGIAPPTSPVDGSLTVHVASERKASQANILAAYRAYTLPAWAIVDGNARLLRLPLLPGRASEVSLHVTNLLDTRYAEFGQLGVDTPALRRSVFLRWTQAF